MVFPVYCSILSRTPQSRQVPLGSSQQWHFLRFLLFGVFVILRSTAQVFCRVAIVYVPFIGLLFSLGWRFGEVHRCEVSSLHLSSKPVNVIGGGVDLEDKLLEDGVFAGFFLKSHSSSFPVFYSFFHILFFSSRSLRIMALRSGDDNETWDSFSGA